jgi:hypothetical protein
LAVVHPVSRAIMFPQLRYAIAHRAVISKIPLLNTIDAYIYFRENFLISQRLHPPIERVVTASAEIMDDLFWFRFQSLQQCIQVCIKSHR